MTLTDCFDRIARPERTITVYAPPPRPDLVDRLARETGVVAVDYRELPAVAADDQGFLVVRDGGDFCGSIGLEAVRSFFEPPIVAPWDETPDDADHRRVIEVFETTVWHTLRRRQLLAISREIESRAWRVGNGTLRVGFQRSEALEAMAQVYVRLAAETTLDIHVYVADEWGRPAIPAVTIHTDAGEEVRSFWFLTFDGGDDELWTSGLLARELEAEEGGPNGGGDRGENGTGDETGTYEGYWTDDPQTVATIERAVLESAAADA